MDLADIKRINALLEKTNRSVSRRPAEFHSAKTQSSLVHVSYPDGWRANPTFALSRWSEELFQEVLDLDDQDERDFKDKG